DSGRAAGEGFRHLAALDVRLPLVEGIALLVDGEAFLARERDEGLARDAGKDGAAERRRRDGAVLHDEEDVHAAQFLDPAMLGGIEKHDLVAALRRRFRLRDEACGIVAAALGGARAAGGRAG